MKIVKIKKEKGSVTDRQKAIFELNLPTLAEMKDGQCLAVKSFVFLKKSSEILPSGTLRISGGLGTSVFFNNIQGVHQVKHCKSIYIDVEGV